MYVVLKKVQNALLRNKGGRSLINLFFFFFFIMTLQLFIEMVKCAFGFPVVAMVSHIPVKSRIPVNDVIALYHNIDSISHPYYNGENGPMGFTGLHGAAFLGIVKLLEALLEMKKWDVNVRDDASCTPLIWAGVRGHEEVVKMLLERGDANPDLADS